MQALQQLSWGIFLYQGLSARFPTSESGTRLLARLYVSLSCLMVGAFIAGSCLLFSRPAHLQGWSAISLSLVMLGLTALVLALVHIRDFTRDSAQLWRRTAISLGLAHIMVIGVSLVACFIIYQQLLATLPHPDILTVLAGLVQILAIIAAGVMLYETYAYWRYGLTLLF